MKIRCRTSRRPAAALLASLLLGAGIVTGRAADAPELPPLTTVPGRERLPGKFVWADLVTDDVAKARRFYAQVFGWRFRELGAYTIALTDERPLAGMFQRPRPADPAAEPRWFGYISVPNVEKAQRAVTRSGGRVLAPPEKMPARGEQAVFADAEGAVFGVLRSSAGDPEDFLAEPGGWIWIQLLSRQARQAADFYRAVAGYDVVETTGDHRLNDYVLVSEGYARATVRTIPAGNDRVLPVWLPYLRVRQVSETLAQVTQSGGKVLIHPTPKILDGHVAVIADPTGAAVGILEWQEGLLKGGQ